MRRNISFSELEAALTCQAKWDFGYGGHLVGGMALVPKQLAARASAGSAWGAGAAAWHATGDLWFAHQMLRNSYKRDVAEQSRQGFYLSPETEVAALLLLHDALDHYARTAQKLDNLTRLEGHLEHPISSRTGHRSSNVYRFEGFVDGITVDENGNEWLVEFKWRQPIGLEILQLSRQPRSYAWVRQRQTGRPVIGVIIDERMPVAPKPPRIVQGPRPSHDRRQLVTPEDYLQACKDFGVEPKEGAAAAFGERIWQTRTPIPFSLSELQETGRELISGAQLIADLDSGRYYPLRNAQKRLCGTCKFLKACPHPEDHVSLSVNYNFVPPKRHRDPREHRREPVQDELIEMEVAA